MCLFTMNEDIKLEEIIDPSTLDSFNLLRQVVARERFLWIYKAAEEAVGSLDDEMQAMRLKVESDLVRLYENAKYRDNGKY